MAMDADRVPLAAGQAMSTDEEIVGSSRPEVLCGQVQSVRKVLLAALGLLMATGLFAAGASMIRAPARDMSIQDAMELISVNNGNAQIGKQQNADVINQEKGDSINMGGTTNVGGNYIGSVGGSVIHGNAHVSYEAGDGAAINSGTGTLESHVSMDTTIEVKQTREAGDFLLKNIHEVSDDDFWDQTMEPYLRKLTPKMSEEMLGKLRDNWKTLKECKSMQSRASKICATMSAAKNFDRRLQANSTLASPRELFAPFHCNNCNSFPCPGLQCCMCISARQANCVEGRNPTSPLLSAHTHHSNFWR